MKKQTKTKPSSKQISPYDQFMSLLRFNIRFKLTLGYAIRLTFLAVFILATAYFGSTYTLYKINEYHFNKATENVEFIINSGYSYNSSFVTKASQVDDLKLYVYGSDKNSLYSFPDKKAESYDEKSYNDKHRWWNGREFKNLYYKTTKKDIDGNTYYLVLKKPLDSLRKKYNLFMFPIGGLVIILFLASLNSASKMTQKHLEPINTMTAQVRQISAKNLNTRLDIRGTKDELKDLAYTFNVMLDGIAHSYEREKQFVSDASHELRTPIAVIKGYASLIKRWGKDDKEVLDESINAIVSETDSMQSLVESLLFIARKDRGTLKMDFEYFCISDLANEIIRDTKLIDKSHIVIDKIEPNLIQKGSADKLKQAFRILVDNSLKYTPDSGKVEIDLRASEKHNIFVISDTGIGISSEDLPHIFDRFYRADKSRTRYKEKENTGGTGLGLSIAKIIIEQHGGKILVESEIDIGTIFTIFLPKEPQRAIPT